MSTANFHAHTDRASAMAADVSDLVPRAGRLSVWIYLTWLTTYLVEGPLRGGLSAIGMPNVLYLRDLVAVAVIASAMVVPLTRGERPPPGLVLMSWLIAVHVCIGILLGGTVFQRLFGLKTFIPMLMTVAIFPAVEQHFRLFIKAMAVFFAITVVGVLVNEVAGEMPWEGLSYETAFGSVQTTKQWWMSGGVRRLPGFARASFDAAMMIGLSGVMLMAAVRSVWLRLLIACIGGAAIFLTTSKGMIVAYAVATLWLVFANRSNTSFKLGRGIVVALLLITCLVPTIFMVVPVRENPADIPVLLTSLWDRFAWMWPAGYSLLPDGFGALTGAGPGGIGSAVGDGPIPSSADSIFVYYYVSFGLLGIGYLAFPALALARGEGAAADPNRFVWAALLIIAYGYGLSINMVEQTFFISVFGLLYGKAFAYVARSSRPVRQGVSA